MNFCNSKNMRSEDDEDFIIDDYEDYNEFRTHSTQSTNSTSSMRWSTDARKQIEEDWKEIEKIFYGEADLPEGKKKIKIQNNENHYRFSSFRA